MHIDLIVSKFSRFQVFGDSQEKKWQPDKKLERHMQCLLKSNKETTEEFWVRYFLHILRENIVSKDVPEKEYAKQHLSAYLQNTCIVVANELTYKYRYVKNFNPIYNYQDYFQIANIFTSDPEEIFRNFYFDKSSSLQSYLKKRLMGKVRDKIYKDNHENWLMKYKDWALLRKIAKKKIKLALQNQFQNQQKIEQYLLVWHCFKEIYSSKSVQNSSTLPSPTSEDYQIIADYYNHQSNKLSCPMKVIDEDSVQKILTFCIDSIRKYLGIQLISLDREAQNQKLSSLDYWEEIIASKSSVKSSWDWIEENDIWQQINLLTYQAFVKLSDLEKILLRLRSLGLSQTEIALIFNAQQYKISRQLIRCRKKFFLLFKEIILSHEDIQINKEKIDKIFEIFFQSNSPDLFFNSLDLFFDSFEDIRLNYIANITLEYNYFYLYIKQIIAKLNISIIKLYLYSILFSDLDTDFENSIEFDELIIEKLLYKYI